MLKTNTTSTIPFTATLRSEWTKLISVRSTWWTIAAGVLLALTTTVGVAIVNGVESSDWSAAERAAFDPVGASLMGGLLLMFTLVVVGVRMGASEYASGMVRLTFAATPRRGRVLAARAALLVAVTLTVGSIVTVVQYFGALSILDIYGVDAAGASGATRAVVATAALSCFLPLLGLFLSVLFRSTGGPISMVQAIIIVPTLLGGLLPAGIRDNVLVYLPDEAMDSITYGGELALGGAIAVAIAWMVLSIGSATAVLRRRDA